MISLLVRVSTAPNVPKGVKKTIKKFWPSYNGATMFLESNLNSNLFATS